MKRNNFSVRREQRKSLLFKEISKRFMELASDEKALGRIYPTRVELSPGNGVCFIYFSSIDGEKGFDNALETLKLYKPSVRRILSEVLQARHTPEVLFKFDSELEKELKIQTLIEKVKTEDTEDLAPNEEEEEEEEEEN